MKASPILPADTPEPPLTAAAEVPCEEPWDPGDPLRGLSCLLESLEDLNASADLDQGLEQVAARLGTAIAFDSFAVLLLDEERQELTLRFGHGFPEELVGELRCPVGEGVVGRVAATGRAQAVDDVDGETLCQHAVAPLHAEIALPLLSKGRVTGVLDLGSRQRGFFTAEHRRLLRFLAGHLATAIENANLLADTRRQAQTLELLHGVSRELASILDRDQLLPRLAELLKELIDYELFGVMLLDAEKQQLESAFVVRRESRSDKLVIPLDEGVCGWVARHRRAVRLADVTRDPRFIGCGDDRVRSELVVPLMVEDRLIGVLDLESYEPDAFSTENERTLTILASTIAIALDNAALYERVRGDEQRLARDLATAREMHNFLLPRQTPWLPGLQTAVAYCSARQLGGDVFDFLGYGEGRTAIVVGDVAGKGTSSALYGAMAVGWLRGYVADNRCSPSCFLANLNAELLQIEAERRFLALTFAVYDHRQRSLTIANAGVPYPVLLRGGAVSEIVVGGIPVGRMARVDYAEVTLRLAPGDVVVFTSDGIDEGLDADDEPFGFERLQRSLAELPSGSAQEIADGVLDASSRHIGGRAPSDDRTVVVLKVTGD